MTKQIRIHDGIIAVLNVASLLLAIYVSPQFLWLAGLVAAVMASSVFTGFCPVHYSVNKLFPPARSA